MSVETWPWEPTAPLRSALCRRGRLGGARRFGAHRGRRGAGHIVAAARLELVPTDLAILTVNAFFRCINASLQPHTITHLELHILCRNCTLKSGADLSSTSSRICIKSCHGLNCPRLCGLSPTYSWRCRRQDCDFLGQVRNFLASFERLNHEVPV